MGDSFASDLSKIAVAQIASSFGFHASQQSAFSVLTDVLRKYIEEVGAEAAAFANHACRTEPNIEDVKRALEELNAPFMKLLLWNLDAEDVPQFAKSGLVPFPIEPVQGIIFPEAEQADAEEETESLPPHVPDFLPPFPPKHTRLRRTPRAALPSDTELTTASSAPPAQPVVKIKKETETFSSVTPAPAIASSAEDKTKKEKANGEKRSTKRAATDLYNAILLRGPRNQEEKDVLDNAYFKPPVSAKAKRIATNSSPLKSETENGEENNGASNGTAAGAKSMNVDADQLELIREGT